MSEYEPGTVAVATYCGEPNIRVSRYTSGWARLDNPDDFVNDLEALGVHKVTDVRPLVVLDPEDRADAALIVNRIASCSRLAMPGVASAWDDAVQAALRSITHPPKPPEPTGLGAVVEDASGDLWVRDKTTTTVAHWKRARGEMGGRRLRWADITAVRVLSEGVTDA